MRGGVRNLHSAGRTYPEQEHKGEEHRLNLLEDGDGVQGLAGQQQAVTHQNSHELVHIKPHHRHPLLRGRIVVCHVTILHILLRRRREIAHLDQPQ